MQEQLNDQELKTLGSHFARYDSALESHRLKFEDKLFPLLNESNPQKLLSFWINFSSDGKGMTEPVEGWIRRAGHKCVELGYTELGKNLEKHAIHEANHHLMMIKDTKNLVELWNKHYSPKIQSEILLERPDSVAVKHYQDLHENYIAGNLAYCQIAIEYEIENLSATYGFEVLEHTFDVVGNDIKPCLSFLLDHAQIDIAHTQFNQKTLSQFLVTHPDTTDNLIEAGIKALKSYGNFLEDCWERS
jgi:hypothetical protein